MPGLQPYYDPANEFNKVIYSSLKDFEKETTNKGVSIKYVCRGAEFYQIDGAEYRVGPGQFLLINHRRDLRVQIHSEENVEGICLYLDPSWIADYQSSCQKSRQELLDDPFHQAGPPKQCKEMVYPITQSPLQKILQGFQLPDRILPSPDLYYHLAAAIARHEWNTRQQIERINADKKSTREELHRRLMLAVNFIHDQLDQKLLIRDVARQACLSEFHFMRSFKQAFGVSPNQYILRQRIAKARQLLKTGKYTVGEVSSLCGFSDYHYFSRCFKKVMGCPPSAI